LLAGTLPQNSLGSLQFSPESLAKFQDILLRDEWDGREIKRGVEWGGEGKDLGGASFFSVHQGLQSLNLALVTYKG